MPHLFKAQRTTIIQFLKFGVVGGAAFVLDVALFHVGLDLLHFNRYGSALFSFPFCATFAWIGNRLFTFRHSQKNMGLTEQWARFFAVATIAIVINRGTFSALTATVPLVYDYPALGLMAGTGAGMFFNFFFARRMVFK